MGRIASPIVGVVLLVLITATSVGLLYIVSNKFQNVFSKKVGNLLENTVDFYDVYVDLNNRIYLTIYSPEELDLRRGYIPILIRNENGSKKLVSCITGNEKVAEEKGCLLCLNCNSPIKGKYVLELDLGPIECDFFTLFDVDKERIIMESIRYVLKGKVVTYFYPINMSIVREEKVLIPYEKFVNAPDFSSVPWMIKYSMYRLWYEVNITPDATDDIYVYFEIPESVLNDIARYCHLINDSFCETFEYARLFEYYEGSGDQVLISPEDMSKEGHYTAYSIELARGFVVYFDHLDEGKHYFVLYFPYEYYNDMESYPNGGKLSQAGEGYDEMMFICEDGYVCTQEEKNTGNCEQEGYVEILNGGDSISTYGDKIIKLYSYGDANYCGYGHISVCFNFSIPFNSSIRSYVEIKFKVDTYSGGGDEKPTFGMWIVVKKKSGELISREVCFTDECPGDIPSQYVGTVVGSPLKDSIISGTGVYRWWYNLEDLFRDWVDNISEIKRICFRTTSESMGNRAVKLSVLMDELKIINEFSTNYLK